MTARIVKSYNICRAPLKLIYLFNEIDHSRFHFIGIIKSIMLFDVLKNGEKGNLGNLKTEFGIFLSMNLKLETVREKN